MRMSVTEPYLPSELINEILLRLPQKSIVGFRCVSKNWHSLISSPYFATLHLIQSKKKGTSSRSLVIISKMDETSILYTVAREDDDSRFKVGNRKEIFSRSRKLDYGYRSMYKFNGLTSCDGLVCLSSFVLDRFSSGSDISIYLMNPVKGELKKLPPHPMEFHCLHHNWVGFGFEPVNREYKVVKIVCYTDQQWHIRSNVSVYSLNSVNDSWRILEDILVPDDAAMLEDIPLPDAAMPSYLVPSSAIIINGVAHWVSRSGKVYSFDLLHEVRRELPSLPIFRKYFLYEMAGSQLAAFCYNPREGFPKAEIWAMKKIGVQEPWIKRGIIDLSYPESWNHQLGNRWNYYPVIGQWNDDEILFQHAYNGQLVLYNTKNNMKRNLEIDGLATPGFLTMSLTESLLSC